MIGIKYNYTDPDQCLGHRQQIELIRKVLANTTIIIILGIIPTRHCNQKEARSLEFSLLLTTFISKNVYLGHQNGFNMNDSGDCEQHLNRPSSVLLHKSK